MTASPGEGSVHPVEAGGRQFQFRGPLSGSRASGEDALGGDSGDLPADHRADWARSWGSLGAVCELWSDDGSECHCSIVLDIGQSRALPGYELWRVDRLGGFFRPEIEEALLRGLAAAARRHRRVLSVSVGLCTVTATGREALSALAGALGYVRAHVPRAYERTSMIRLDRDREEILADMHASCRRGIRAIEKRPLEVRLVRDLSLASRLDELHVETMERTGGKVQRTDWRKVIAYASDQPGVARLVGTWAAGEDGPTVLAFALGLHQGDCVEYRTAASTRENVRSPIGYALVWDLMLWGREAGARWFDFGGLPSGPTPTNVEGIVRFKEGFGGVPIEFREEWVLETRPGLESLRRSLSGLARIVSGDSM